MTSGMTRPAGVGMEAPPASIDDGPAVLLGLATRWLSADATSFRVSAA